jgi:predicted TIM-barrel fold metal-dependent hydrolase
VCSSAEDLARVDRLLAAHPNLNVDIAARIAELGRQPRATRALIERHSGRVLFGTDWFPPERASYELHFRFLETLDESFAYGPDPEDPWPQGRWSISALGLDGATVEAVYAGNARRVLRGLGG